MKQTIENRAVIDCIGFDVEGRGHLAVRFQLASFRVDGTWVDDGSRPLNPTEANPQRKKHRVVVEKHGRAVDREIILRPGDDIDMLIAAITPHLESMGYSGPSEADVAKLKAIAAICWTPEAVERHNATWQAWLELNNQHCSEQGIPALTLEAARLCDYAERIIQPFVNVPEPMRIA